MDPRVFEAVAPTLGGCVIPAIPVAAHRADHAVGRQFVLNGVSGIRATPIRMMPQSPCGFPAEPRPRQRIGHNVRRHAGLPRPAHHFTVEPVESDRQREPACIRTEEVMPDAVWRQLELRGPSSGLGSPPGSVGAVLVHVHSQDPLQVRPPQI